MLIADSRARVFSQTQTQRNGDAREMKRWADNSRTSARIRAPSIRTRRLPPRSPLFASAPFQIMENPPSLPPSPPRARSQLLQPGDKSPVPARPFSSPHPPVFLSPSRFLYPVAVCLRLVRWRSLARIHCCEIGSSACCNEIRDPRFPVSRARPP